MLISRTTGSASVVPELVYPDVDQAVVWLCDTFGFTELWRVGGHRARLAFGNGVIILADAESEHGRVAPDRAGLRSHAVLVKVGDVDAHHARAQQRGAQVLSPPTDYPYGERQYSAVDLGGHHWTFTQALTDLAPEDWGGTSAGPATPSGGEVD